MMSDVTGCAPLVS